MSNKSLNTYYPSSNIQFVGAALPFVTRNKMRFIYSKSENKTITLTGSVPFTFAYNATAQVNQLILTLSVPRCARPLCSATVRGSVTLYMETVIGFPQEMVSSTNVTLSGTKALTFIISFPPNPAPNGFYSPLVLPTSVNGSLFVNVTYTYA